MGGVLESSSSKKGVSGSGFDPLPILGGVLLSLIIIFFQYKYRPWGITEGFSAWVNFRLHSTYSLLILGILWGAFISANFTRKFAIRIMPGKEALKAFAGGLLMGAGAVIAGGGNITAFYTSLSNLSGSALLMFAGLFLGVYIGVIFEAKALEQKKIIGGQEIRIPKLNLIVAVLFLGGLILTKNIYLWAGALIGCVLQIGRLCFLNAFREPFISGECNITVGVIISLALAFAGIGFLKMKGMIPENTYIFPEFGWSAFTGGMIFGLGMTLAGAGSEGILWKLGEGHIKFLFTLIAFLISYKLISLVFLTLKLPFGKKLYLPHYLNYWGSFALVLGILLIWLFVVLWNRKTKKLVKAII